MNDQLPRTSRRTRDGAYVCSRCGGHNDDNYARTYGERIDRDHSRVACQYCSQTIVWKHS